MYCFEISGINCMLLPVAKVRAPQVSRCRSADARCGSGQPPGLIGRRCMIMQLQASQESAGLRQGSLIVTQVPREEWSYATWLTIKMPRTAFLPRVT